MIIKTENSDFSAVSNARVDIPVKDQDEVNAWVKKLSVAPSQTEIDALNVFVTQLKQYNLFTKSKYIFITNKTVKSDCFTNLNATIPVGLPNGGETYTTDGIDFTTITSVPKLQIEGVDLNNCLRLFAHTNAAVFATASENMFSEPGNLRSGRFINSTSTMFGGGTIKIPDFEDRTGSVVMNRSSVNSKMIGADAESGRVSESFSTITNTSTSIVDLGCTGSASVYTTIKPKLMILGSGFTAQEAMILVRFSDILLESL